VGLVKPTMRQGDILPELNKEIVDFNAHIWGSDTLKNFLDKFHHVDTYFNPISEYNHSSRYRIQGHITFSDLPETLPTEFVKSQFEMVEIDGELVFEVWSMNVLVDLPF
jgi:hypothetical protein